MQNSSTTAVPQAQLTLFRSVCIIVGVIVGSGIFESPPDIAGYMKAWYGVRPEIWFFLLWIIGGVLSFMGALCYAELATAYPREGGDYVYLNRAFGGWAGFLFGWARLTLIQAGSIGAIAYVFGDYATRLLPLGAHSATIYALAGVVVFTALNAIGVREGTLAQNVLTSIKVLALCVVFVVGFLVNPASSAPAEFKEPGFTSIAVALIVILWTYGGWNEIAYIAAEVKDPRRNIVRSLMIGLTVVTVIYLLVNVAFLHSMGLMAMRDSKAVAADVLKVQFGERGLRIISMLVVISALGALNGFIITSARVYYAMGVEHRLLAPLGRWNSRFGTPAAALIFQGIIILVLLLVFGSRGGFSTMVFLTAMPFWSFLVLTTLSLIVLRYKDRDVERPFRVPLFPAIPIVFAIACVWMVYRSVIFKPILAEVGGGVLIVGLVLYLISVAMTPNDARRQGER
jgi:amino acid transporter